MIVIYIGAWNDQHLNCPRCRWVVICSRDFWKPWYKFLIEHFILGISHDTQNKLYLQFILGITWYSDGRRLSLAQTSLHPAEYHVIPKTNCSLTVAYTCMFVYLCNRKCYISCPMGPYFGNELCSFLLYVLRASLGLFFVGFFVKYCFNFHIRFYNVEFSVININITNLFYLRHWQY